MKERESVWGMEDGKGLQAKLTISSISIGSDLRGKGASTCLKAPTLDYGAARCRNDFFIECTR